MEQENNDFELLEPQDALELVPTWEPRLWWLAIAIPLLIALFFLIRRLLRKKITHDPHLARREAYQTAKQNLADLSPTTPRETATALSLILRTYLAIDLREPALYETHEEFIGRGQHLAKLPPDLRETVIQHFSSLATLKYAPENTTPHTDPLEIHSLSATLLDQIHHRPAEP